MSTRAIEDADFIAKRIAEIRADRMAIISGCTCPPNPLSGVTNHAVSCPFGAGLPPATPPSAMAMQRDVTAAWLADHRRAVADWVDSHVRHKLWTGPEEYTKGMGGCAVDCPHPDHKHAVADWAEGEIDWTDTYADGVCR